MKEENKLRADKYWICDDCAKNKKWEFPKYNVTRITNALCGWCDTDKPQSLTPIVDFKRGDIEPVWD